MDGRRSEGLLWGHKSDLGRAGSLVRKMKTWVPCAKITKNVQVTTSGHSSQDQAHNVGSDPVSWESPCTSVFSSEQGPVKAHLRAAYGCKGTRGMSSAYENSPCLLLLENGYALGSACSMGALQGRAFMTSSPQPCHVGSIILAPLDGAAEPREERELA